MTLSTHILIIGRGRVAQGLYRLTESIAHSEKNQTYECRLVAGRSSPHVIEEASRWATHVYIAVPDSAIHEVARHCEKSLARLVHFAAAVSVPGVARWHPMAAFGANTPQPADLSQVLFVGEPGQKFSDDFPGFVNPNFVLPADDFVRYHALCFLGVGLTMGPMKHAFAALKDLGLPATALKTFFSTAFAAFIDDPLSTPSGPHTRKDWGTLRAHKNALKDKSLTWYESLIAGTEL